MAIGDKLFLADKETLDTVNRNLSDVHSRVGTTGDTGGTATAGSVFGKLNAIISSIAAHVANWTAARAAKIDNIDTNATSAASNAAAASAQTAANHTASATGTLSQKLSHIINNMTNLSNATKRLTTKIATISATASGDYTLIDITGAGYLEAITSGMFTGWSTVTIIIDGVTVGPLGGSTVIAPLVSGGALVSAVSTGNTGPSVQMCPVYFNRSLKVVFNAMNQSSSSWTVSCKYGVYE